MEIERKYNDNGTYKDIYVKAFDTLPVGTEVNYDGSVVPSGWVQETITKIEFTPIIGSSHSGYGGCYYYKIDTKVHVHIGIGGLSQNTNSSIYIMPESYRPAFSVIFTVGIGNDYSNVSAGTIGTGGGIVIMSSGTYAQIDFEYDAL